MAVLAHPMEQQDVRPITADVDGERDAGTLDELHDPSLRRVLTLD
jgi:hypothetical protein